MSAMEDEHKTNYQQGCLTWKLIVTVFGCVIGSSFQYGYHVGVLNNPQQLLQDEYKYGFMSGLLNSSSNNTSVTPKLDDKQTSLLWSLTVAMFGVGGLVGGVSGGYVATKLGRKKMMLLNNIILVVAVACMVSAKFVKLLELMIIGRLIHGVNCGFSTVVAPLYLNEISPVNLRGRVGTIHQLTITSGILISQVLGLKQLFGTIDLYYLLFAVPLVAGVLQLMILPFCPESPSWLFITKNEKDESRKALIFFGKSAFNVDQQLSSYETELNEQQSQTSKVSCCDMITKSYLRTPLLIAVVMHLSQQWSGIVVVLNYSTSIFISTGLTEGQSQYATLGTSGVIVFMTLVSVLFMDRVGRRILHLTGLSGCLVSLVIVTVALFIQDDQDWAKYLSVVAIVLFILLFASGPGSIPWFITAELFDQTSRSYAISIAILVNWFAFATSGLLFPIMQSEMGNYSFIPHIVLLACFVLFVFFKVPETRNKTTEEIISMFQKGNQKYDCVECQLDDLSEKIES